MRQTLGCNCEVDSEDRNNTHNGMPHLHVSPDCTQGHGLRPLNVEDVAPWVTQWLKENDAVSPGLGTGIAIAICATFGSEWPPLTDTDRPLATRRSLACRTG